MKIGEIVGIIAYLIIWISWLAGGIVLVIFGDNNTTMLVIGIIMLAVWVIFSACIKVSNDMNTHRAHELKKQQKEEQIEQLVKVNQNKLRIIEAKYASDLSTVELVNLIAARNHDSVAIVDNCKKIISTTLDPNIQL